MSNGISDSTEDVEFVALLNLIVAGAKVLDTYCAESATQPGWAEFTHADLLLSHTTWLGDGSLLTIQCMLLKALYCMFVDKPTAAVDAVNTAVRLCYQLGLHDERLWSTTDKQQTALRPRIFWALYSVDRTVSLTCGAPYRLRDAEFRVEPPSYSDEDATSLCDSPSLQVPDLHLVPYLYATAKWGRLCSEIWDALFSVRAQSPVSREFIAAMDGRIMLLLHDLPHELQWTTDFPDLSPPPPRPLSVSRQSMIINLVSHESCWLLIPFSQTLLACQSSSSSTQAARNGDHEAPRQDRGALYPNCDRKYRSDSCVLHVSLCSKNRSVFQRCLPHQCHHPSSMCHHRR